MRIQSIRVQNLRSLEDVSIELDDLTALIGPNGAGKSSFLRAIDLFYDPVATYSEGDFYNREIDRELSVRVTFTGLGDRARNKFSPYLAGERLSVEKVMSYPDNKTNQRYYGNRLYNSDFDGFRNASGHDLRREYQALQEGRYSELPDYQNQTEAEQVLRGWEEEHPDQCERRRDDGQFFGFNPVGKAALEEFTQFILIPAVREASKDAEDTRGSPLTELMDLVVRATLAEREDLEQLRETTQESYEDIISEAAETELDQLEGALSSTLGMLAPGAAVELSWLTDGAIEIPMPKTRTRLVEDEFASSVEHTGHGLQRAFIITLLQHLTVQSGREKDEEKENLEPSLILAIEEPELYQHPNRQRHLISILSRFGEQGVKGVASSVQVVYSTHSPLMVRMKRFDDVRAVKKLSSEPDLPNVTTVQKSSLEGVARELERISDVEPGTYTSESTRARLEPVMTPWINEGFFSKGVILVEGAEDRAAILGRAKARGMDLGAQGMSVLPCGGKTNLDRPAIIFSDLGINIFVVFDSDYDEEGEEQNNRRLLRLLGAEEEEWPEGVCENYACFRTTLTDTVKIELGEEYYQETLRTVCDAYGYAKLARGAKNATVMAEVFEKAAEDGLELPQIDMILERATEVG